MDSSHCKIELIANIAQKNYTELVDLVNLQTEDHREKAGMMMFYVESFLSVLTKHIVDEEDYVKFLDSLKKEVLRNLKMINEVESITD